MWQFSHVHSENQLEECWWAPSDVAEGSLVLAPLALLNHTHWLEVSGPRFLCSSGQQEAQTWVCFSVR